MIVVKKKKTMLDLEIENVLSHLKQLTPSSKEYSVASENLERLYKSKEKIRTVSPDTILSVAGSLLGIVLILGYEQANVVTSKAIGFVLKGRV